jgi:hypothetical protein
MVCLKFKCHVYKLKGWLLGNPDVFILELGVQRGASIVSDECPKKIADGPMNMAFSKQKKKKLCELI